MENKTFVKEFEVHYYEIDRSQKATPRAIINYLQDTAISHSTYVGHSVSTLKAANIGWVLYRWFLIMDRYPILGEKIFVETWPSGFERFHSRREFLIKDRLCNIIGKASSIWIFFDMNKRKPVRITSGISNSYYFISETAIAEPFSKIDFNPDTYISNRFSIRRNDIDTNNHVNNICYIDWIMETLPADIYLDYQLHSLEIIYKKEVASGDIICSVMKDALDNEISDKATLDKSNLDKVNLNKANLNKADLDKVNLSKEIDDNITLTHKICDLENHELAVSKTIWKKIKD